MYIVSQASHPHIFYGGWHARLRHGTMSINTACMQEYLQDGCLSLTSGFSGIFSALHLQGEESK